MGTTIHTKLAAIRVALLAAFAERESVIDGLLTALIAREHVLLLGPPGTAKSALTTALTGAIEGARCFTVLLTRFSTPEEVFGPVSLTGLQEDDYRRVTAGRLPEAEVGFVDEVFNANSAVLNALLTAINERRFDNGRAGRIQIPLQTLVGASNELPEGKDLEAFFDRFALRYWLGYIADRDRLRALLATPPGDPGIAERISLADLGALQTEARSMPLGAALLDALLDIKVEAEAAGLTASDRTWRKAVQMARARATLDGAAEVEEEHLEIVADMLWREPEARQKAAAIVGKRTNPIAAEAVRFLDAAKAIEREWPEVVTKERLDDCRRMNREMREIQGAAKKLLAETGATNGRARRLQEAITQIDAIKAEMMRRTNEAVGLDA